jgi:hypothetical protein
MRRTGERAGVAAFVRVVADGAFIESRCAT